MKGLICINQNLSAKVSNYESVENINKPSNASHNTKRMYLKYKDYNIFELEEVIKDSKI
ncbi:hypothetical protein [Poseidonibacter lekithochrous]|uniref:hypothetical protein n=1 Tax=Poseidonibacter lekithochrous TaxID=1904463 RepID=UPI000A7D0CEE|nr:hypothetical protein [Poseidonibacter lekithochrous]QKJ22039.1 hypothetical protein ALEK_0736 [Poseidonibacter lekithochrous]